MLLFWFLFHLFSDLIKHCQQNMCCFYCQYIIKLVAVDSPVLSLFCDIIALGEMSQHNIKAI